jgi:hypothetical protein
VAPLRGAAPVDRRKEAAEVAAGDSQMEVEEAEVCRTEVVGVVELWTVVEEAEARKAGEVVDHDVSEKWQPWERQGRVELLLKSSTTSRKRIFH